MDTKLIEYLKDYLSKNDLDGLVINSTNEFLVEYNMLELNSRYYVTGFTGSTGDVLFTNDKIYLFVALLAVTGIGLFLVFHSIARKVFKIES